MAKALASSNNPSKVAQQQGVAEKEANANKGVAPDATKPPTTPQDQPKEKKVPTSMEIVLATLPLPAKGDLKSKDSRSSEAVLPQSTKGKNCIKKEVV